MGYNFLHLFENQSAYDTARSNNYEEPWVSLIQSTGQINYNKNVNGYKYVDLGLTSGTLWATCNVGAKSIGDSGIYVQYGNIDNCTDSNYSTNINNYEDKGLDAAEYYMGEPWSIPTITHIQELLNGTTQEWVTNYSENLTGCKFTSNTNGNVLFIPAVGYYNPGIGVTLSNDVPNVSFWTSTISSGYPYHVVARDDYSPVVDTQQAYKVSAMPVRAIVDGNNNLEV